jgi:hypothetical protein
MALVPKGRENSARGFNPWLTVQRATALKGRQKLRVGDVSLNEALNPHPPPLQGGSSFYRHPGVETRAESLSPFGTKFPLPLRGDYLGPRVAANAQPR